VLEQTGREGDPQKALEQAAVRQSLKNMMSFSFITEAVADGQFKLDGAWLSIAEGELLWLDRSLSKFEHVSE